MLDSEGVELRCIPADRDFHVYALGVSSPEGWYHLFFFHWIDFLLLAWRLRGCGQRASVVHQIHRPLPGVEDLARRPVAKRLVGPFVVVQLDSQTPTLPLSGRSFSAK